MNRMKNRSRLAAFVLTASATFAAAGCGGGGGGGEDKAAPALAQQAAPNELNGIYRWTLTKEDALASESEDQSPTHLDTFPWIFTMTLKDGNWTLRHTEDGQASTDVTADPYSVQGNRISFDWREVGTILIFTFSVEDEGDLHLQPVDPMNAGDQFVWATHPWTKID